VPRLTVTTIIDNSATIPTPPIIAINIALTAVVVVLVVELAFALTLTIW